MGRDDVPEGDKVPESSPVSGPVDRPGAKESDADSLVGEGKEAPTPAGKGDTGEGASSEKPSQEEVRLLVMIDRLEAENLRLESVNEELYAELYDLYEAYVEVKTKNLQLDSDSDSEEEAAEAQTEAVAIATRLTPSLNRYETATSHGSGGQSESEGSTETHREKAAEKLPSVKEERIATIERLETVVDRLAIENGTFRYELVKLMDQYLVEKGLFYSGEGDDAMTARVKALDAAKRISPTGNRGARSEFSDTYERLREALRAQVEDGPEEMY